MQQGGSFIKVVKWCYVIYQTFGKNAFALCLGVQGIIMESVKFLFENQNINNTNGSFSVGGIDVFYKALSLGDYFRELYGYSEIKKCYSVEPMLGSYANNEYGVILYKYDKKIGLNSGLLLDYFTSERPDSKVLLKILKKYYEVFSETLSYRYTTSHNVFYKNRIASRLFKYYDERFWNMQNTSLIYNGKKIVVRPLNNVLRLVKYFNVPQKYWVIVSQCDPTDLNITMDGIILDYYGGGYNPLMAEFSMFVWQNLMVGDCLAPKYNNKYFDQHPRIFQCLREPQIKNNCLWYSIRPIRLEAIFLYIDTIIEPILQTIPYDNWYIDFKNFLVFKMITIFNLKEIDEGSRLAILSLSEFIYNKNIYTVQELKKLLNDIVTLQ